MFTKEQIDFIETELRSRKTIRKIQKRAVKAEKRAAQKAQKAQRRALHFKPIENAEE